MSRCHSLSNCCSAFGRHCSLCEGGLSTGTGAGVFRRARRASSGVEGGSGAGCTWGSGVRGATASCARCAVRRARSASALLQGTGAGAGGVGSAVASCGREAAALAEACCWPAPQQAHPPDGMPSSLHLSCSSLKPSVDERGSGEGLSVGDDAGTVGRVGVEGP